MKEFIKQIVTPKTREEIGNIGITLTAVIKNNNTIAVSSNKKNETEPVK